jgi:D-lactate dehydrogenase (cytochrome)
MSLELLGAMLPAGLVYPPDPTERTATIGGTIATNASGARTYHYGATRQWVQALQVVLPTGAVLEIERGEVTAQDGVLRFSAAGFPHEITVPTYSMPPVKNAAGLYAAPDMDLVDLFVGDEGLLGVVTQARLKLAELPDELLAEIAFFDSLADAFGFVADLRAAKAEGLPVLSIELFDGHALSFMQHPTVTGEYAAAIYTEIIGTLDEAEPLLAALEARHVAQDWFAEDAAERQEQKDFRHSLPDGVNGYLRRQGSYKLGTDFAVPADQFPQLLELSQQAAAEFRARFPHEGEHTATWGHLGNHHLHFNFLARNAAEMTFARELYAKLARQAVAMGGTISAEHGVGKKTAEIDGKTVPYLQLMYGEEGLEEIAAVKRALDPKWILNPGNMVPIDW